MKATKWCLIGLPDDEGVRNVNGRMGAGKGPAVLREFLEKINGAIDVRKGMVDLDDIPFRFEPIIEKHEWAVEEISQNQSLYDFSVIVGGGHDYVYCQVKGVAESYKNKSIGCINIDPHLDMRKPDPDISSGSPFYLLLDQKVIPGKNLVEFGIQPHSNAPALWKFAKKNKANIVAFDELRFGKASSKFRESLQNLAKKCEHIVLSLDMDALGAPFAPGVSAPAIEGFTPSDILEIIKIAAEEPKVISLGIYELNPNTDQDNRTARLAAAVVWYFAYYRLKD